MSDIPEVSVVTTTYNAEAYIDAAVTSVLQQRGGVELEHVIVDDGSTDATRDVLSNLSDPRVRVIEAGRVGRARALNLALSACRGEYVAIQDADDMSHPERLATELLAMRQHSDLAIVGSGQIQLKDNAAPAWRPLAGQPEVRRVTRELLYYNPLSHSSVLIRRRMLDQVGGYDEQRDALFDWNLYIRIAATGAALGKLSIPLVAKRIHDHQFFEGRRQIHYAAECLKLQCRAVVDLNRNRLALIAFPLLFGYRIMSRPARMCVRRYLTDRP